MRINSPVNPSFNTKATMGRTGRSIVESADRLKQTFEVPEDTEGAMLLARGAAADVWRCVYHPSISVLAVNYLSDI